MVEHPTPQARFEIGSYDCPTTKAQVVLELSTHMASLEWPVTVECCPDCGQEHVLQYKDVQHAPALGYE
jgi:transposase